jgi:hypothetical protein
MLVRDKNHRLRITKVRPNIDCVLKRFEHLFALLVNSESATENSLISNISIENSDIANDFQSLKKMFISYKVFCFSKKSIIDQNHPD